MKPQLDFLISSVLDAGNEAAKILPEAKMCICKESGDFATSADLRSQEALVSSLHSEYPTIPIIAEEDEVFPEHLPETFFSIDPFDGTIIASRGGLEWGVLLSYVVNSQPVQAVMYQPMLNRMIAAESGAGTFFFDLKDDSQKKLSFSNTSNTTAPFLLGYDMFFHLSPLQLNKTLVPLADAITNEGRIMLVKSFGSSIHGCFDLLLAHTDAFFSICGGKIWDYSPGALAVREAGGADYRMDHQTLEFSQFLAESIYFGVLFASSEDIGNKIISCVNNALDS